jgi:hypothetical protein
MTRSVDVMCSTTIRAERDVRECRRTGHACAWCLDVDVHRASSSEPCTSRSLICPDAGGVLSSVRSSGEMLATLSTASTV